MAFSTWTKIHLGYAKLTFWRQVISIAAFPEFLRHKPSIFRLACGEFPHTGPTALLGELHSAARWIQGCSMLCFPLDPPDLSQIHLCSPCSACPVPYGNLCAIHTDWSPYGDCWCVRTIIWFCDSWQRKTGRFIKYICPGTICFFHFHLLLFPLLFKQPKVTDDRGATKSV